MFAVTLSIVATLAAGFISRNRSATEDRWRLALGASTAASIGLVFLSCIAVATRGYTNFGAAVAGFALILLGAHCIIVQRVTVERTEDGAVLVSRGRIRVGRPPFEVLVGWTVAMLAIALMPLRHAGALADSTTASKVLAVLTPAAAAPLSERRPIAIGQCITSREVEETNRVTSCLADHGSQVLEVIDPTEPCLDTNDWSVDGIEIRITRTKPIDGRRYCVASMTGGMNDLRYPIYPRGLAQTL